MQLRSPGWRLGHRRSIHIPVRGPLLVSALLTAALLAQPAAAGDPAPSGQTARVPVLMYHRISCPPPDAALPTLWICPRRFARHMDALVAAGWRTMTARQVLWALKRGAPVPPRTFVIVIDDGDRDGFDNAYPILRRRGLVATYAVVVGRIGKRVGMTWPELQLLISEGHEVASHTMNHDDVRRESDAGLVLEVATSAQRLQQHLGIPTRTFVYPFGLWNTRAAAAVRAAGYWGAFTTWPGCSLSWSQRLVLDRVRINGGDQPSTVLAKVRSCS